MSVKEDAMSLHDWSGRGGLDDDYSRIFRPRLLRLLGNDHKKLLPDLKPRNILIYRNAGKIRKIVLIDFEGCRGQVSPSVKQRAGESSSPLKG